MAFGSLKIVNLEIDSWFGLVGRRIWKRTFGKLKIETSVQMFVALARSTPGGVGGLEKRKCRTWELRNCWLDGLVV